MPMNTAIDKAMGGQTIANAMGVRAMQGSAPQGLPMDDGTTPEGILKQLASGQFSAEQLVALLTMLSGLGGGGLGGPPGVPGVPGAQGIPGGGEIAGPIGQAMLG
jgi:hypothetical protein